MSITEAFSNTSTYGITYVSLSESGLHFESEAAVHTEDGGLLTLRMPTRQSEKMAIHSVICMQNGWCQAA
ncbi:type III secretion system co-regulatory protein PtrC [Pseudomonas sp. BMS12]|uniref:type III secretion system co-regulatory protein PtrC n=1 Tax=Pseudomonas sp. BMS12 TaxID=1796033 RepID=UPI00083A3EFD|nr:type III secretion system co-regulatory protein PtrC [Pseudomonas sp. BMS12]